MRHKYLQLTLAILFCIVSSKAFAYDIAVKNEDGVTLCYNYINDGKELELTYRYEFPNYISYEGIINIPETVTYMGRVRRVTRIGSNAFNNNLALTSVTIPKSVTSVGDGGFDYCKNLTSLTIHSYYVSTGQHCLEHCDKLLNVYVVVDDYGDFCNNTTVHNFSERKTSWGYVHYGVTLIDKNGEEILNYVIPEGVKTIGERAFEYCSHLTSITIPKSMEVIGPSAFSYCI